MPRCLALCDDLIFASRITGFASAQGVEAIVARSPALLHNMLEQGRADCLLVDLHHPGLVIVDLLAALPEPRPFVVAYGSHVDAPTLSAARQAGCDLVLPRSSFVERLGVELASWCGPHLPAAATGNA